MPSEKQVSQKVTREPEVIIRGWLKDIFKENHKLSDNTVIFETVVRTVNFWGNVEPEIPVQIDGRFLKKITSDLSAGDFVEIHGEMHTKNIYDESGNKIQRRCYVFAKEINPVDEQSEPPTNFVCVRGVLARKGKVHHCKNGNSMFDFTLDIRRSRGRRSSIPCVVWGKARSQLLANMKNDTAIEVEGWLKSRIITDSAGITKSVIEIIVDSVCDVVKKT